MWHQAERKAHEDVYQGKLHLQVSIVPLVTVNISELLSRDSDDHEQAAVTIKPRTPVSQEKLVSVVFEYTLKKPSLESAHPVCYSPHKTLLL